MSDGPVALVILDGLGLAPPGPGNAVSLAHLPVFDELWATMPHTTLAASGLDVGLPEGQMGNSEVGHLNLGAGRVVPQTLVRIGAAVADGSLARNPAFIAACDAAVTGRGVLHLAGLVSDGGVHSHVDHLRALVRAAIVRDVPRVAVHAFTDGRDVSPHQAADLLAQLEREWEGTPAELATVIGRFYAMDRDGRTERTERARAAMVDGVGTQVDGRRRRGAGRLRARHHGRVRRPARARRPRAARAARRPALHLQLPARPHARAVPRARRHGRPARDDDALRRVAARARSRSTTARSRRCSPRSSRARGSRSCTSPRPRSTPT